MRLQKKLGTVATLALMAAMFAAPARGQVLNSGASPIALQAVLTQSISVTLSGNAVNFNLVAGSASNPGSASITATTAWTLKPSVGSLKVYAFFSTSTAALTDGGGTNIPSADFQISFNPAAFTPLPTTLPFAAP